MKKFKFFVSFLGEFAYSLVLESGLYMSSALILVVLAVRHYEVEILVPTIQIEESVMKFVWAVILLGILIGLLYWRGPKQKDEELPIQSTEPPEK